MIATSDAHRLHAFGRHYTSMPMPPALTIENVFAGLRSGPLRLTSPASSLTDFVSAIYFVFLAHPFRVRRKIAAPRVVEHETRSRLTAEEQAAPGRKLRPNRRTRRGMLSLPMGGCLIGSLFFRPGPKRYSARPKLSRRRASLPRHSSRPLTDHWPCRNRILPSTDGQGSRAQLCGLAAKLDDCRSGKWRIGLPRGKGRSAVPM